MNIALRAPYPLLALLLVAALLSPGSTQAAAVPAAGGSAIVQTSLTAGVVAVGRVRNPSKIDTHGYRAEFYVENVLSGDVALGNTLVVAWEELAQKRPVRFENEDVVLLVLNPLPTQSIWRKRFKKSDGVVRVIAANGDAFLREPSPPTTNALQHFLKLSSPARETGPGLNRLIELVATADLFVAEDALEVLSANAPKLKNTTQGARWELIRSVADDKRDEGLRRETLAFIASAQLDGAKDLIRKLADVKGPIQADAWRALDSFDDGLSGEEIERLLQSEAAELRAVGASIARADAREALVDMLEDDPDPTVRISAIERLVMLEGAESFEAVAVAFADEDVQVGAAAAGAIGRLGPSMVPKLRDMANNAEAPAPQRAVMALSLTGPAGKPTLRELHLGHEDRVLRNLAGLALGKLEGQDAH